VFLLVRGLLLGRGALLDQALTRLHIFIVRARPVGRNRRYAALPARIPSRTVG
jgi:hypothetical protein